MAISTPGRAFLNRSISAWYQLARLPLPTVRFNFVVAPAALALAAAGADATEPAAPAAGAADDAATEAAADAAGADEDAGAAVPLQATRTVIMTVVLIAVALRLKPAR